MKGVAAAVALYAALAGPGRVDMLARSDQTAREAIAPLPRTAAGDARKAALGRDLFFDRRLSGSTRLNCASCHDLQTNGASPARIDRGDRGVALRFNTPTVFNSVYSFRLGWEGKARSLRNLALGSMNSAHLMSGGGLAVHRLASDSGLVARFVAIYGTAPNEGNVADALAAFLATLTTPDAPFDRWLRGDKTALTAQQVRGYARFKALGCASCHQGMNVGANIFQRRGIFHPLGGARPSFLRVPSLRNVAVTAPYFHDGRVDCLPEAIRQMAHSQLDLEIGDRDVADITAFLGSLTGAYRGSRLSRPVSAGK